MRDAGAQIEKVIWASHNQARIETNESLTGVATSIRASNEKLVDQIENRRLQDKVDDLSRDHDVGGVVR